MSKISEESKELVTKQLLTSTDAPEEQIVYAMCGIPASGKTTYVQSQIKAGNFPQNAFILNPDLVMENLPEYQKDEKELGAEKAFLKWEIPSRTLAYKLFHKAKDLKKTIIVDMGCARDENRQMLMSLKEAGYKVLMTHVKCDIDTAIERTSKRERFTPADMIYKRANTLEALIPQYKVLAEEFTEIDTSGL
ncbi:MAG: AAA family ATPase [Bdellovibrionales bacterium]